MALMNEREENREKEDGISREVFGRGVFRRV